jgi:uncharacterized membrane protein YdjX (TVP38/TMEM64 family)
MKAKTKWVIFLGIVILSLVITFFAGYLNYSVDHVQSLILHYKAISILIYIALIAIAAATTLPITVALIAGILVFTFTEALLYAFLGVYIGAFVMYILSIKTGKEAFHEYGKLGTGKLKILNRLLHKHSFSLALLFSFVYFFPSNIAHIVAGVTNMNFWKFSFVTIVGNFPNVFAVALLVVGVLRVNTFYFVSAIIILILVTIIPLYVYRKHMKDIILIAFSKDAWKRFERFEKLEKEIV